tara:strand:+ start:214 stop:357 length:144 start_codon:yes stop_codon:yes gene_type:complete
MAKIKSFIARPKNMKKTSIGLKRRRIKTSSMNKSKKRSFKLYKAQGR